MKFLIDARGDGETITADLADCSQPYPFVDRIDVDINTETTVPCRLSTARSLEAEAVKEAAIAIREFIHEFVAVTGQSPTTKAGFVGLNEWLEKWDTK